jgi:hypothetical protein
MGGCERKLVAAEATMLRNQRAAMLDEESTTSQLSYECGPGA